MSNDWNDPYLKNGITVENDLITVEAYRGDRGFTTRKFTQFLKKYFKEKNDLIGIEIGVFRGENLEDIAKNLNCKLLIGVDCWCKPEYWAEHPFYISHIYLETWWRLNQYENIILIKSFSKEASKIIGIDVDFIYIDGSHYFETVLEDLKLWFPKVKKGGIFGGHDWNSPGVNKAIREVFKEYEIFNEDMDWWIIND